MKYIIELDEDAKILQSISVTPNGNAYTSTHWLANLEELNSDYINEHYGVLQDDAYKRGFDDGYKECLSKNDFDQPCVSCDDYKRGLDDAWEAARKIIHMPEGDLLNIFTECYSAVCTALQVLLKYDASEAIAKLKAFEEKQKTDDKFEFGDEIIDSNGEKGCVVSKGNEEGDTIFALFSGYRTPQCIRRRNYRKTGKRYDIQSILEAMRK